MPTPVRLPGGQQPMTREAKPNAGRSVHGIPKHAQEQAANPVLRINGAVGNPVELRLSQTLALPHVRFLEAGRGTEETFIPPIDWSGPSLLTLIAECQPDPAAQWIRISAGPYAVPIAIERADQVLLCDQIDGEVL